MSPPPDPRLPDILQPGAHAAKSDIGDSSILQPTDIIIHDNGSTDPDTLRVLDELEASGAKVFRASPISTPEELNRVNDTIERYFSDWAERSRYVVTDCDIDMSVAKSNALEVYDELLTMFRRVECAGPMLRIRDIPESYPLFNRVMNRHIDQFWRHTPTFAETLVWPGRFSSKPGRYDFRAASGWRALS